MFSVQVDVKLSRFMKVVTRNIVFILSNLAFFLLRINSWNVW